MAGALPYRDVKAQGAADFYFCINATFAFIARRLGDRALRCYWKQLGSDYMSPVWMAWREGGLDAVADYLEQFYRAEPGSVTRIERKEGEVELHVLECPAIGHLRSHGREPFEDFCRHCYFVMESAARRADLTVRVEGGDGRCVQRFIEAGTRPTQNLSMIRKCHSEANDAR